MLGGIGLAAVLFVVMIVIKGLIMQYGNLTMKEKTQNLIDSINLDQEVLRDVKAREVNKKTVSKWN